MTHPQEGLEAWTEQVHAYRIPRYDELPTLELYMDQVVAVIDDCLRIYLRDSKAQRLTPAMISSRCCRRRLKSAITARTFAI